MSWRLRGSPESTAGAPLAGSWDSAADWGVEDSAREPAARCASAGVGGVCARPATGQTATNAASSTTRVES